MNALLTGLVDDAGLFPPTALPPAEAVARHRRDRAAGHPMHTLRLLVPVGRLDEVRAKLRTADRLRLGLIADTAGPGAPADRLRAALATVAADDRLETALIEAPLTAFGTDPAVAVPAVLDATAGAGVPVFLEPAAPDGVDALLAAMGTAAVPGLGAKLRCGGVRAGLFPSPAEVAHFVTACARSGVPFKATAGLHHAVRHRDPGTGFTHHGYLNLLLAAARAAADPGEPAPVLRALETTDAGTLARDLAALSQQAAHAARALLVSYGSCSTRTPVSEARTLLDAA
ncbi:hypothetical protein PS467_35225 [Streptomyces luomodiensis]|uniref:HpcH/HpaI aldolase/citrate lyase domain-containing protein n=1 Tax=Streptomyces luomodiensis TaxID=3026192 RepID=A0ABY9V5Q7_9ACTN|nr:hypothetical protein [Streptomyces sp. SCA4-21]WNF00198.1 hypothetical protein PS467_35225 [Streptomyces sp. SCA4-21]